VCQIGESARGRRAVLAALRRRGLEPRDDDGAAGDVPIRTSPAWSEAAIDSFYGAMQRYSFRLVLRDVIRLGAAGSITIAALVRHASESTVREHLRTLVDLAVVRARGEEHELVAPAESLGPALEWFIAEVMHRELGFAVARSIPLRGGATGGDLDVAALAEGVLLAIEVKSGPPKHVQLPQLAAFLDRAVAVAPHGAIFFEDTELRMSDKVLPLFAEAALARGLELRPRRLQREVFALADGLYVANAHPEVVGNLTLCVCDLLRARGLQLSRVGGAGTVDVR
jgi:hypothetical protein